MMRKTFILLVLSVLFMSMGDTLALALAGQRTPASVTRDIHPASPTVTPETVDLGVLRPGEEATGAFFTNANGAVNPDWFAEAPEGWKAVGENGLPGLVGEAPAPLQVRLHYLKVLIRDEKKYASLNLRMEAVGRSVSVTREVPLGDLREKLQFNYVGGTLQVFVTARLTEMYAFPSLALDMYRLDLGKVRGDSVSQRIQLTSKGIPPLKWKVRVARAEAGEGAFIGRYVSFRRLLTEFPSLLIGQPQEGLELSGNWEKKGGYPAGQGEQSVLSYQFAGTGITLHFWKSPEGGTLSAFLDGQFTDIIDGYGEAPESAEVVISDRLTTGPHILTVVCGDGKVVFEGATISGGQIVKGPRGLVTVFPDSGVTTRETDYVNISVATRGLLPGVYGQNLLFSSNGGDAEVPLFFEVGQDRQVLLPDVHRYLAGSDILLTASPQTETARIQARGYRYGGVAFRLFAPGTPGTTEFYRWFNPNVGDYFYSYNTGDAKRLPGYIYEGPIGNIGTSKLAGTRELYRWVNRKTKHHFYTTDLSGEGMAQKGYQYDAVAGFVK